MKALTYVLVAGGVCWIISEVLELVYGGRTGLTLALTAAFHLLMAGGIWAAYVGQGSLGSQLSLVATGLASAGYLVLVYPPIAIAGDLSVPYPEFIRARPVLMAAGLLATLGVTLFGAGVVRARAYPAWVGVACLVSPGVFASVTLAEGPLLIGFAANILLGSAFVAMGVLARRSLRGNAT